MALLQSELDRIRFELGFNLLTIGAEPYIGITAIFDQVIAPNTRSGALTSSSTAVTSAGLVSLTLASATGFHAGDRIVVDVDDRQESATAETVSGAVVTIQLSKVHSGTYPVTVEGGESIIRECLQRIRDVKNKLGTTFGTGMLKQVDEIQFYNSGTTTLFGALGQQLAFWRSELASAIGIASMWESKQSAGSRVAVY